MTTEHERVLRRLMPHLLAIKQGGPTEFTAAIGDAIQVLAPNSKAPAGQLTLLPKETPKS